MGCSLGFGSTSFHFARMMGTHGINCAVGPYSKREIAAAAAVENAQHYRIFAHIWGVTRAIIIAPFLLVFSFIYFEYVLICVMCVCKALALGILARMGAMMAVAVDGWRWMMARYTDIYKMTTNRQSNSRAHISWVVDNGKCAIRAYRC